MVGPNHANLPNPKNQMHHQSHVVGRMTGCYVFWGERRLSFPSQNKRGKHGPEIGMEPDGLVATNLPISMGLPGCTP
jgi:hypothetical protein